jgi:hypothetical protein
MGKFDRKANKHEPDAPTSQKIQPKKSNKELHELSVNRDKEKDRSLKILQFMEKAETLKTGKRKADASLDTEKLANKHMKKEQKHRSKINKKM